MPAGPEPHVVEDAAAFFGAICDADNPPKTEEEARDAAAWRAASSEEVARRTQRMIAYNDPVRWADGAIDERDAQDGKRAADAAE